MVTVVEGPGRNDLGDGVFSPFVRHLKLSHSADLHSDDFSRWAFGDGWVPDGISVLTKGS